MVDFRKDTWLYALIASILAIISLFTPARIIHAGGEYGDMIAWLGGGIMLEIDSGTWHEDLFSQLLFGATLISITLLLIISINSWRGKEIKRDSLIYLLSGTIILMLTIFFWIFEFDPDFETISFATIGIFISGIISILAFTIDRLSAYRNK
ncbi:MAG: hypothetical protein ACFFB0_03695 [Promethearchaeota archaeon]